MTLSINFYAFYNNAVYWEPFTDQTHKAEFRARTEPRLQALLSCGGKSDEVADRYIVLQSKETISDIKTERKVFSVGHGIGNMTSIHQNLTRLLKTSHFSRAVIKNIFCCFFLLFFLVNLPIKFSGFLDIFLKWRVERKVLHSDEGHSLWKVFFFFFFLDSLPFDLGPRPSGQQYYYVEMCQRVLKTLRRMVNIKVFYKKVYNHLDIYTNTQIYIHIYMYIPFYNMAIEKSFNYVSNYLIINHIGLERSWNSNSKS